MIFEFDLSKPKEGEVGTSELLNSNNLEDIQKKLKELDILIDAKPPVNKNLFEINGDPVSEEEYNKFKEDLKLPFKVSIKQYTLNKEPVVIYSISTRPTLTFEEAYKAESESEEDIKKKRKCKHLKKSHLVENLVREYVKMVMPFTSNDDVCNNNVYDAVAYVVDRTGIKNPYEYFDYSDLFKIIFEENEYKNEIINKARDIKYEYLTFEENLSNLIHSYNLQNDSNTPDFILAKFIIGAFDHFNAAVLARDEYHMIGTK